MYRYGLYFYRLYHAESDLDSVRVNGTYEGEEKRIVGRLFSGLLIDMFYGSVFGFYALIYMYVGFISGYAHRIYYDNDIKIPMILVAGGDLLYNLAVYGLQFLLRGRLGLETYIYRIIIPEVFTLYFLPSLCTEPFTILTTTS